MKDFTSGSATRQILLFSIPMLVGNLFQQVYSMADAIVVGRFVGGTALAAVGVAMSVLQFLLSVLIGLTTGASVIIAQLYGARQHDKLRGTVSTSVVFLAGFALLLTALGLVFTPLLLRALNAPPAIFGDAALYMRVIIAGMVFPVFYNMYTAYLRALGDSRNPLFILIFCTLFNIGLDLLFVARFHWGVAGAAVATVIAQAASALLCWLYVRRRVPLLRVGKLVFQREAFRDILRYGTPAALQLSLVSLANLSITRLINSFGEVTMAGVTAATKIDQFATMPVVNLNMALSTFVAQNLGAGLEARAKKGFRSSLVLMLAVSVCISGLLIALGPQLLSQFVNPDDANRAAILETGLGYMNIMVLFYVLFAFLFGFNGFFRGAGDAVIAMVFPVVSLSVRTLSAHLLVHLAGMGAEALAWSIPIGWGLTALASWGYYRGNWWRGKVVAR